MESCHTLVAKDIKEAGAYSSAVMPLMVASDWRKNAVRIGQLNDMALRLKKLENLLKKD